MYSVHRNISIKCDRYLINGLYSDETAQYRTPMEPEPGDIVTVRFRTLKNNVDAVYFISGTIRKEMKVEESREEI